MRPVLIPGALALLLLAGCGDDSDDGESSQEAYCAAGDGLRTSVEALVSLDLLSEGTNGLEAAIEDVRDDVDQLRSSASEAAEEEVAALDESVDDLRDALAAVGDELSVDNVGAVRTAVEDALEAAQGVYETLTDCP